ncbi:MAG TPA: AAA family ATPase [Candidatus Angelobacter sp.]|nr:AAA family ATPase [Candidatus Angelobacter sp.]
MAINLDQLSPNFEDALERSRLLAETRGHSQIAPEHLLYTILEGDSDVVALCKRAGVQTGEVMKILAQRLGGERIAAAKLEPGTRPTASRALRTLIEKSFLEMQSRQAERAEPLDFVAAVMAHGEEPLIKELRAAGVAPEALSNAVEKTASARQMLGEVPSSGTAAGAAKPLAKFARDLTAIARAGELMPVVGRDEEIRRVIQILLRKTKSNPVCVGDPGTGKTSIVEGLALRIASGDVPESLKNCRVMALDLTAMVAGAKYRGEFEERIKTVVDECRASKGEIILFLDELHTLVGAGGNEGGMDAANILKPALARGEIRCLGATTFDEYREKIERDGALSRRFDVVTVKEPTDEAMLVILRGIRARYESYHGIRLADDALQAAVKLSRRYLRSRFLPDKAIDVIDEACARIRMQKESKPTHIDQMERLLVRKQMELESTPSEAKGRAQLAVEVDDLKVQVGAMVGEWREQNEASTNLQKTKQAIEEQNAFLMEAEAAGNITRAAEIRYGSLKYLEQQRQDLEVRLATIAVGKTALLEEVKPEHIAEVIAERVGIPINRMLESERERLVNLESRLAARVFGQDDAVQAVAEAVRRMRADLETQRKPNSFLFVGPTGTGKTELAKALAEALFDDESALIRIDMGEYKEKGSVSGLIGSRPGLIGSDEGGFLTERVRRSPYSIVLFDEVEKAHPEILDLLLGVLDEGRLTDAKGRFCDFSNTLILFTSNLGVREAMAETEDLEQRRAIILEVVKASLRPELYNRISQVLAFNALSIEHLQRIVGQHLDRLKKKMAEDREIELSVTVPAIEFLAADAHDPAYGARPVGRTVQQLVISPLATALLGGEIQPKQKVVIHFAEEEGLTFDVPEEASFVA